MKIQSILKEIQRQGAKKYIELSNRDKSDFTQYLSIKSTIINEKEHPETGNDVVFMLDGTHSFDFQKQIIEKYLSKVKYILIHDTVPKTEMWTKPELCGNSYLTACWAHTQENIKAFTIKDYHGLTILEEGRPIHKLKSTPETFKGFQRVKNDLLSACSFNEFFGKDKTGKVGVGLEINSFNPSGDNEVSQGKEEKPLNHEETGDLKKSLFEEYKKLTGRYPRKDSTADRVKELIEQKKASNE